MAKVSGIVFALCAADVVLFYFIIFLEAVLSRESSASLKRRKTWRRTMWTLGHDAGNGH